MRNPSYTGLILDDPGLFTQKVLGLVPDGWAMRTRPQPGYFSEKLPHHMTVCMGRLPEEHQHLLGKSFNISVTAWGKNDKALAVLVTSDAPKLNEGPKHVTVAISDVGKPADSNSIVEWMPLTSFESSGTMTEVFRDKYVICINNDGWELGLTIGQCYKVIEEKKYPQNDNQLSYLICNNENYEIWFVATRFIPYTEKTECPQISTQSQEISLSPVKT